MSGLPIILWLWTVYLESWPSWHWIYSSPELITFKYSYNISYSLQTRFFPRQNHVFVPICVIIGKYLPFQRLNFLISKMGLMKVPLRSSFENQYILSMKMPCPGVYTHCWDSVTVSFLNFIYYTIVSMWRMLDNDGDWEGLTSTCSGGLEMQLRKRHGLQGFVLMAVLNTLVFGL